MPATPPETRGSSRRRVAAVAPGGDDHDDLAEPIVALQFGDCCGHARGCAVARLHPTRGHLTLSLWSDGSSRLLVA